MLRSRQSALPTLGTLPRRLLVRRALAYVRTRSDSRKPQSARGDFLNVPVSRLVRRAPVRAACLRRGKTPCALEGLMHRFPGRLLDVCRLGVARERLFSL